MFLFKQTETDIPIDVKIEFIKKHLRKKLKKIKFCSTEISNNISNGYVDSLIKEVEYHLYNDNYEDGKELKKKIKNYLIKNYLKETTLKEYSQWLYGYLKNGGKIFNYYDWNFKDKIHQFFTARKSFIFPVPFFGDFLRFNVLVPDGIQVYDTGNLGHCHIYNNDFTILPNEKGQPGCYNDVFVEINKLEKMNN